MARIRSISPEACESRALAQLTDFEERTFTRMWTQLDDQGRSKDDATLLCSKVYAVMRHVTEDDFEAALARFAELGLIIRYGVKGQRYLQVRSWPRHQSPNNPAKARIPAPPGWHIDPEAREWARDEEPEPSPEPPPPSNGQRDLSPAPQVALPEDSPHTPTPLPHPSPNPGSLEVGSRKLEIGDPSSSSPTEAGLSTGEDDDDRIDQALAALGRHDAEKAQADGVHILSMPLYQHGCTRRRADSDTAALAKLAADHPDWTAQQLADHRLGRTPAGPPPPHCDRCGTLGHPTAACPDFPDLEAHP